MACLGLDSEASCGPMAPATRTSRHRWGRGRNKACLLVSYRPLASRAAAQRRCSGGGIFADTVIIGLRTPVYIAAAITSTSTTTAKRLPKLSNLTL